jgi:MFS family permease
MAQPIQFDLPPEPGTLAPRAGPWWRQLTGYHWFVFLVASLAWLFDCLDQRLFSLARIPALASLMHKPPTDTEVQAFGKVVTAWFLIGWGVGGMFFGALGDRFGRARMLNITVLIYSAFTGLTFFSHSRFDFTLFRFMTGLGVGGVFGLAVALIAETVPSGARVQTLGLLQVLSTAGNLAAGFIKLGIDRLEYAGVVAQGQGWRWVFLLGAIPAILVIFTGRYLKEPAAWLKLKESGALERGGIFASYGKLFSSKKWRRNVVVGAMIASTGVIGLWAIGEYAVDLQRAVFRTHYAAQLGPGAPDKAIADKVNGAIFWAYQLNMLGAGFGMWLFTRVTQVTGRRVAFFLGFLAALLITAFAYWRMKTPADAYWMMPLMGAAQLGTFAGFAIYLPELFPSSLRSTGTSFCYNLGRFAAAGGSFFSAVLTQQVFGGFASPLPLRYSAITMCAIFLLGLIVLPFAPETKGKPLPVDDPESTPEPVPSAFPVVPAGGAQPAPRGT